MPGFPGSGCRLAGVRLANPGFDPQKRLPWRALRLVLNLVTWDPAGFNPVNFDLLAHFASSAASRIFAS